MAYADLLINWCTVLRYPPGGAIDPYGTPAKVFVPVPELDDIPCRLMPIKGVEIVVGAEVVVADYKLFLGDVVLTEQDRVAVLLAAGGAVVTYEILSVNNIQDGVTSHHKECYLRTVR